AFHDTLNSIDANISFTIEIESDNKISFLDTLVTRRNGTIAVDVYRKPTHTDRYLDYNSHHDNKHKASTAATLLHRALKLPNSSEGKERELNRSFASLPYIKGITEPLTRVLKKHDITVVNKPLITLQQQFPAPKFRPSLESQTNVVYKIPCGDCSWCYIGETGRAFKTRKKEHLRNVKTAAKGSRIANHVWANSHAIDFDNASII
ncbi:unnamed protein product, partial [Pocillopora meandrina]